MILQNNNLLSITLDQLKNDDGLLKDFISFFFGFELYPYQFRFLIACLNNTRVAGLWSRQSGKSQTVAIFCLLIAIFDKKAIIIAAPTDTQARLIYGKVTDLISNNEELKTLIVSSIQEETKFKTGSTIKMITVGPFGITKRGHTCNILIEEESQDIKDSIHNSVLMPFLASKKSEGQVVKIGTAKKRGHFSKSCFEDKNFKLFKVKWEEVVEVGQYSLDFIEEQKLNLTDFEFKAEYCCEFIDDINAYFPIELIDNCMIDYQLIKIL